MLRLLAVAFILSALPARAAEPEFALALRGHRFMPAELPVPANTRIKLVIANEDSTAEEFESYSLNVEKRIKGNSSAAVFIGPLKPGRYDFVGEYHEKTARGTLVAQ